MKCAGGTVEGPQWRAVPAGFRPACRPSRAASSTRRGGWVKVWSAAPRRTAYRPIRRFFSCRGAFADRMGPVGGRGASGWRWIAQLETRCAARQPIFEQLFPSPPHRIGKAERLREQREQREQTGKGRRNGRAGLFPISFGQMETVGSGKGGKTVRQCGPSPLQPSAGACSLMVKR